jgi:hypothetical protein
MPSTAVKLTDDELFALEAEAFVLEVDALGAEACLREAEGLAEGLMLDGAAETAVAAACSRSEVASKRAEQVAGAVARLSHELAVNRLVDALRAGHGLEVTVSAMGADAAWAVELPHLDFALAEARFEAETLNFGGLRVEEAAARLQRALSACANKVTVEEWNAQEALSRGLAES